MLLGYVRPHRWALVAGGLLSPATGATGLALPLAARALVGDLGHHRGVTVVLVLMTVLVVANAGIGALGNYVLRRTAESVVGARRLSTVTMADQIIVMDAGLVQVTGTHAELVAANPLYVELTVTGGGRWPRAAACASPPAGRSWPTPG